MEIKIPNTLLSKYLSKIYFYLNQTSTINLIFLTYKKEDGPELLIQKIYENLHNCH